MESLKNKSDYYRRIEAASSALERAECILVGGGAGLSAAAGLDYSGKRFTDNFADFIENYGFEDMYSATFYRFKTEEERWAHWARHILLNRYETPATELYKNLLKLVSGKAHFAITTNVESQFSKAGFDENRIFATQGDYGFLQCAKGCHKKVYQNEQLIRLMARQTKYCRIPSPLVPKCPLCGEAMDVNLRKDNCFVQDKAWYMASERYAAFLKRIKGERFVLLELGVGFNTPGIIRYPFERLTYEYPNAILIRINRFHKEGITENRNRTIAFAEDMGDVINRLL
jgi:NAD-dependent SIR2 family protein deacetylase